MNLTMVTSLARELRMLCPDRGNRYAPRSVRTKGAAAYAQWESTVAALANWLWRQNETFNRDFFIASCHVYDSEPITEGDYRYYHGSQSEPRANESERA